MSSGEECAIKVYPKGASAQKAHSVEVESLRVADQDFVPNIPHIMAHGDQHGYLWLVET